jgi:mannosyltransferase
MTLAALILRATQLHQSLFGDEVLAYGEIAGHTLSRVLRTVGTGVESSPPLFFVLAWLSAKLGDPTVWIRLPSLVLGVATIPVVYLLGRETVGRTPAVIAASITAASPFATYYGVEARPYATMEFFVSLSTLALVRAVRTDRRRDWAAYALATSAAAYSHYTVIFALLAQAAWSLWACRGRWRRLLTANGAAVLLYVPWLSSLHGSALGVYTFLEPLTASHVLADILHPVAGYPYAPLTAIPTLPGLIGIGACALLGLALAWRSRRTRAPRRPGVPGGTVLIAVLALATPLGLLPYSLLGTDLWSERSLIASAPAQALLLGTLLAAIRGRAQPVAIAVVVAALAFGSAHAISPRYARPPYRLAARYLDRVAAPADPVLMYSAGFVLDQAIPAQFTRPHMVIDGIPHHWPRRPAETQAFVVIDDSLSRAIGIPRPSGWVLVTARHYGGLVPFRLLTYRAV